NNYGVMVSRDGGKNFVPTNSGFSGRFVNTIVPDREQPNRVYATTINTTTGGGFFFVSNDGGSTWQPSMRNMPPRLIGYAMIQDERNPNTIYLGTNLGIYRSLDRGASWSTLVGKKPALPKRPARRNPASTSKTRKPTTARTQPQRPTNPGERIVVAPQASDEVVRKAQEALDRAGYDIGTPDGRMGQRTIAALKRFQSDRYLPVTGELDETTIGALGLGSLAANMLAHVLSLTEPVNALAAFTDATGKSGILAATNAGLYRTLDPSQGWDRVNYGRGLDVRTNAISISSQNPQVIFVGTASTGVLVSRDGGENWQQMSGVPATSPINIIAQDPTRSAYIYVGTKQAFYLSHDGGEHWSRRGGDLPYGDFTSILINPRNPNEVFAGNAYQTSDKGGGVFRSTDGGMTWQRIDTRDLHLPSMRIWALALDPRDQNTLFVGSHSAGVYVVSRGSEASLNSLR
ncbi:MAG TPA: peptidoglycan-binding protein, partial [Pyrinomonadaceae bacterium]|nr:peptidoglycan-binding protein [Pyrinomonadaceae bacterium]